MDSKILIAKINLESIMEHIVVYSIKNLKLFLINLMIKVIDIILKDFKDYYPIIILSWLEVIMVSKVVVSKTFIVRILIIKVDDCIIFKHLRVFYRVIKDLFNYFHFKKSFIVYFF